MLCGEQVLGRGGGHQEIDEEAVTHIPVTAGGGRDEKRSDSTHIVKIEPTGFPHRWGVRGEWKRSQRSVQVLSPSNEKNGVAIS